MDYWKLPPDQISTTLHSVALTLKRLHQRGISSAAGLQNSRIPESMLKQPAELITRAQELTVFANALARSGDSSIGLEIGASMHLPSYGILGYAMLVSPTLAKALQGALKHPNLLGSYFQMQIKVSGGNAVLLIKNYRYRADLEVFNTDMCAASMWALICDVLGERRKPLSVAFDYPAPAHAAVYASTFGCEPTFNAAETCIRFPGEWLDHSLQYAEPVSCHMALQQCDQLEREWSRAAGDTLMARVLRLLYADPKRYGSLDAAASALCVSGRTLRRHLQAHATSFQQLLDQAMQDRATEYLQKTELSIGEIADRLGYSETSSFRQAFRRWTGQAPSMFRNQR
jgi:AraC-like DNA-binding protein